jgi:deoxyribodipyrimidine photo-lyase
MSERRPAFEPTRAAALGRVDAVDAQAYACSRNALGGAVTALSPYLTHGLVTLPEVLARIHARQPLAPQHNLVFELGWREFAHQQWRQRGAALQHGWRAGPLPESAYAHELPADLRRGATGVPAVDRAVQQLLSTGWLHNHARLWLASYAVHGRRVHWRAGARWMLGHLLDGDVASNTLGWQWVAGTATGRPYLFNADNVKRWAPAAWHSTGSTIDRSYDELAAIARGAAPPLPAGGDDLFATGIDEPALLAAPPADTGFTPPDAAAVQGRTVWLLHPWALRAPPADLPPDTLLLGLALPEWHAAHRWSERRWRFVAAGMAALSAQRWWGSADAVAQALRSARAVHALHDPHAAPALQALALCRPARRLFVDVDRPCHSFSQWWARVMRGVARVEDLPGLSPCGARP